MQNIERIETYPIRIPYAQAVHWASQIEDAAEFLILKLTTRDGLTGVAEGTVKVGWSGTTLRSLAVVLEDVFGPRLIGADVADEDAIAKILNRIPEHALAKSLIDVACWDVRSQIAGKPLWQLWGGERSAPVSYTVTRKAPLEMAREAADRVAAHGFEILKIKTGQGIETDLQALREVRRAVGDGVRLYADSNSAYASDETPAFTAMLKDQDVFIAEDPCRLRSGEPFVQLRKQCAIPLLVDIAAASLAGSDAFVDSGAEALSVKVSKVGYTTSWEIVKRCRAKGTKTNVGFQGESALGAAVALQLGAAFPERHTWLPAETTFYLTLPQQFVHEPLAVKDGAVTLSDVPGFGALVDWAQVKALAP